MEIKPIRTRSDYRKALKEIEALMNARAGTREGARLDVLATLVEAYERKRFPMDFPDPVAAIKFRMEQSGLTPKDVVPMIGQLNRVHEVLNGKRPLTLKMVWRLHRELGIPAESRTRAQSCAGRGIASTGVRPRAEPPRRGPRTDPSPELGSATSSETEPSESRCPK